VKNLSLNIFLLFLLINLLVTGGRIASSDETATFLLVQSLVTRGSVDVPAGIVENGTEHDGKFYIWYEVGQAMLAAPLYLAGSAVGGLLHLPDNLKLLFLKAVMGTFNAFIGAAYATLMFAFGRRLGYSFRTSLLLSVALCLSTFAFPYFKSFLREPLLAFSLLGTCYYLERWNRDPLSTRWLFVAGGFMGLGMLTRVAFLLHLPVILLFIIWLVRRRQGTMKQSATALFSFLLPMIPFGLGVLWYNFARFQNPFDLGYGNAGIAFNIPFYTGLFGLLLSPGKGFFFFAPVTIVGTVGLFRLIRKKHPSALLWTGLFGVNLLFYCTYFAWGGDGSWGPRYLLALLPFAVLPVGSVLEEGRKGWKRFTYALVVLGIFIQLGGTTIYAGTYIREIGEYPYTRSFYDPEFLYKTHFIPNYSPLVGHWKMALRNIGEHLEGHQPVLNVRQEQSVQRIPVEGDTRLALGHTLDYWFCYPSYVGIHSIMFVVAPLILFMIVVVQSVRVRRLVIANDREH
jgi:hypothetical protein